TRRRIELPRRADAIAEPLRQHGAEPRGETAPSVEVAKERRPFAVACLQSKQLGVDAVGDLARSAGRIDGVGRAGETGAVLAHHVLPRRLVTACACGRNRQVPEMERAEIALDVGSRWR